MGIRASGEARARRAASGVHRTSKPAKRLTALGGFDSRPPPLPAETGLGRLPTSPVSVQLVTRSATFCITTAGVVTGHFAIPASDVGLVDITAGPDGNLWFTEYAGLRA